MTRDERQNRDHERYRLLSEFRKTGTLTTRMLSEAQMIRFPFEWMETFAPEWYRAGLDHDFRRPDNFFADLAEYEEGLPKGIIPTAGGLIEFFRARWFKHPWRPVVKASEQLSKLCQEFEAAVWRPWLQSYYEKATIRGHEAVVGDTIMLVWGSAGRVLMTFRSVDGAGAPDFTLIGAENDSEYADLGMRRPRMGVQGVMATVEEARALVQPFIDGSERARKGIHPQRSVTLKGL